MLIRLPHITEASRRPASTRVLLVALGLLLALPASVQAQSPFSATYQSYGAGNSPRSLAIADLNGDGRPDFVVAGGGWTEVSVLLGNGDGTFRAKPDIIVESGATSVAVGDLNADGRPDLVVTNSGQFGGLSALLGNGDGTFGPVVDITTANYLHSVAIVDLNADGWPDLVVQGDSCGPSCVGVVSVLLGNGDGTFRPRTNIVRGGTDLASLAIADLNADGRADLVVSGPSDSVSVLIGNGDGTFRAMAGVGIGPGWVIVADLNADGRRDLLEMFGSDSVAVLLGNGDGTFGAKIDTGKGPGDVTIADLNADGRPDLIVTYPGLYSWEYIGYLGPGTVSVLLGNGDGTFAAESDYGVGVNAGTPVIADVNADGRLDLVVANRGPHGETGDTVSLLLGNGDGTLQSQPDIATPMGIQLAAIADVNADGRPDLVVLGSGPGRVSVALNTGPNTTGVVPSSPTTRLAFGVLAPRPNPSHGYSEIQLLLPSARPVELNLFDVNGRRVWSWMSREELSAGPHTVTWNGRDESGKAACDGVYLLKVRAGRDQGEKKLVLQR